MEKIPNMCAEHEGYTEAQYVQAARALGIPLEEVTDPEVQAYLDSENPDRNAGVVRITDKNKEIRLDDQPNN
jgi:hypothetical protein